MKIFWVQTASMIDIIVNQNIKKFEKLSYNKLIDELFFYGFASLFGLGKRYVNKSSEKIQIFSNVTNSKYIQTKWAQENNINYNENSWQREILAAQIEQFKPDVIYTNNPVLFNKQMKKYLPKAKLYALWNASPMQEMVDLSYFDVGLSFNEVYHQHLQKRGIKNVEYNSFYIDPEIKTRLEAMSLKKDIDIAFVGRYTPMFKDRNQFLLDVYKAFKNSYNIQYFLLTGARFKGLIPIIPWGLLKAYNKPVFLEDMFKVFNRSKIVLNTHSNITGSHKGNMRVFEALGSGSFMLSDHGVYPEHLEEGKDFVTYKSNKDMIEKINYYLKNDKEREEIALNGHKKIAQYYNTEIGSKNLEKIFGKYL